MRPSGSFGQEVGKDGLEHAEFVAPGIPQDPEVEAAFVLVVPALGAQSLEPRHFGLDIVGLDVEVHALLLDLGIVGQLEQDSDVSVGEP